MPSRLAPPSLPLQRQERQLAEQYLARRTSIPVGSPWEGFVPDLPQNTVGFNGCRQMQGLVVRADPQGSGEVLTTDGGWAPVDEARLGASLPSLHASSSRDVVRLRNFPLVTSTTKEPSGEQNLQTVMLVAGDGATAGSFQQYYLSPVTSQWTVVAFSTTGLAGATAPVASIDGDGTHANSFKSMPDSCVFALGAPARSIAAIDQPVFIWTNNQDPVMIYPRASGSLTFQPLTDSFSDVATTGDFRCASVATFNDRVYFLNTYESGVRRRNRLRRTARNTADPAPALGAGHIDMEQFNGAGVSVRPLGNVLACYFTDGVAFVRDTGDQVTPNAVQTLDTNRGLLGTHAVVSISDNKHFGIFDDGWWILDSNGRWQEVGVANVGGKQAVKWRETFYHRLDRENTHRIQCYYDPRHNWVRIAFPTGDTNVIANWNYDIVADRVFPDEYSDGITVWGEVVVYDSTASTWADQTETWEAISGSWAAFQAAADVTRLAHGNQDGYVFFHDDNFIDRDGTDVQWVYGSVLTDMGRLLSLKTSQRLVIEYLNSLNTNSMSVQFVNGQGGVVTTGKVFNDGLSDESRHARCWLTLTGEELGFVVSGAAQIRMRQFQVELLEDGIEAI